MAACLQHLDAVRMAPRTPHHQVQRPTAGMTRDMTRDATIDNQAHRERLHCHTSLASCWLVIKARGPLGTSCTMKDEPEFNMFFVQLVEKQACLYDHHCAEYSNRNAVDRAWETVAKEVSESVPKCKERWKNLRACYTRHLKATPPPGPGSSVKHKKPYYLAEGLQFLQPFTKTRKPLSRLHPESDAALQYESEDNGDCYEDAASTSGEKDSDQQDSNDNKPVFTAPVAKKRKIEFKQNVFPEDMNKSEYESFGPNNSLNVNELENPNLSFLKSLVPDMKEMNSDQKRRFKIGILHLAGKILSEGNASPLPS